jgi:hypothetical protein
MLEDYLCTAFLAVMEMLRHHTGNDASNTTDITQPIQSILLLVIERYLPGML